MRKENSEQNPDQFDLEPVFFSGCGKKTIIRWSLMVFVQVDPVWDRLNHNANFTKKMGNPMKKTCDYQKLLFSTLKKEFFF